MTYKIEYDCRVFEHTFGGVLMRCLFLSLIICLVFAPKVAMAEVTITSCGASQGHDFWITNEALKVGGWKEASIPEGKIVLTKSGTDFDLKITDASGKTNSARSQGATIVPVEADKNNITIIVVHSGSGTEVYSFTLNNGGQGELVWTKIRHHFLIRNGGVSAAKCG